MTTTNQYDLFALPLERDPFSTPPAERGLLVRGAACVITSGPYVDCTGVLRDLEDCDGRVGVEVDGYGVVLRFRRGDVEAAG